jgi:hypothetical protein
MTKLPLKEVRLKARSLNAGILAVQRTKTISAHMTLTAEEIIGKAINTLLEIMGSKIDEVVRVKAAMGLLHIARELHFAAQARNEGGPIIESDEARRNEHEERTAAVADARALLAEIAEAKTGGVGQPVALDQNGSAGADHAAG